MELQLIDATNLLGRALTKTEVQLLFLMSPDARYEMYKDDAGNLAFRLK